MCEGGGLGAEEPRGAGRGPLGVPVGAGQPGGGRGRGRGGPYVDGRWQGGKETCDQEMGLCVFLLVWRSPPARERRRDRRQPSAGTAPPSSPGSGDTGGDTEGAAPQGGLCARHALSGSVEGAWHGPGLCVLGSLSLHPQGLAVAPSHGPPCPGTSLGVGGGAGCCPSSSGSRAALS